MAERRDATRAAFAPARFEVGDIFRVGIIGGLIAGLVFMVGEMVVAALLGMPVDMPPRMIAGIVLGPAALDAAQVDTATGVLVGLIVHFILSAIFGVIFTAIVARVPALLRYAGGLALAGMIYGLVLWLVNFFVIAPAAGWVWFPQQTTPFSQAVLHLLFFGAVLGWYVGTQGVRERATA